MIIEPICPFCGDGPEAIGTMYHIECVEKLMDRIAELEAVKAENDLKTLEVSAVDDWKSYHAVLQFGASVTLQDADIVRETLQKLQGKALAAIAELEAKYGDVVAEHENELALRLEAEANAAEFHQRLLDELAKNALTPTGRDRLEQAETELAALKGGISRRIEQEVAEDTKEIHAELVALEAKVADKDKRERLSVELFDRLKERIAELEAENAGWKRSHNVWCDDLANIDSLKQRAEQTEAELAALKGRRCETCLYNETCDQTLWPSEYLPQVTLKFCSAWLARP